MEILTKNDFQKHLEIWRKFDPKINQIDLKIANFEEFLFQKFWQLCSNWHQKLNRNFNQNGQNDPENVPKGNYSKMFENLEKNKIHLNLHQHDNEGFKLTPILNIWKKRKKPIHMEVFQIFWKSRKKIENWSWWPKYP